MSSPTDSVLGTSLLASVSRSFYLTIKLLPGPLRSPISVAYLLARASDTIADTVSAPIDLRLDQLRALDHAVQAGGTAAVDWSRGITPADPGEQQLLSRVNDCLAWLESLAPPDQEEVRRVLATIIHGQELDLRRFASPAGISALPDAAALDEYTYLVAGCVGEFWTRLCLRHLAHYGKQDDATMIRLGIGFGKGLQLVNILRDLPADLRAGRCYLPANELNRAGIAPIDLLEKPVGARPVFEQWGIRAQDLLDEGQRYIEAVNPWRLRQACLLPWWLGVRTLVLLRRHPPLETTERVKVPRSEVRWAVLWSAGAAFSNGGVRLARRLAG